MHFNDKGRIECKRCRGNHTISLRVSDLIEVCPECNGSGGRDWVEHAMGRPSEYSQQAAIHAVHRNIQTLMQLIYEEGRKIGEYIQVDVKHRSIEDYNATMPSMILRK